MENEQKGKSNLPILTIQTLSFMTAAGQINLNVEP